MKKYKITISIFIFLICIYIYPVIVYANSSWHWLTDNRPYELLPIVAVFTILIETLSVNYISKIHKLPKVLIIITIANLFSFLFPYLITYEFTGAPVGYSFPQNLENWPFYNVGIFYFIITISCELPIVYNTLKKHVSKKKFLLLNIFCSNLITTIMVAVIERLVCPGRI